MALGPHLKLPTYLQKQIINNILKMAPAIQNGGDQKVCLFPSSFSVCSGFVVAAASAARIPQAAAAAPTPTPPLLAPN